VEDGPFCRLASESTCKRPFEARATTKLADVPACSSVRPMVRSSIRTSTPPTFQTPSPSSSACPEMLRMPPVSSSAYAHEAVAADTVRRTLCRCAIAAAYSGRVFHRDRRRKLTSVLLLLRLRQDAGPERRLFR
jgi:hypothetical protein